ncbi:MAG: hypothetical protein ACR2QE_04170 [Acidimicrobiales bacterium]
MTRPLSSYEAETRAADRSRPAIIARSTARALAAAISALLVTTVVIDRSDAAISVDGTGATTAFTSGEISLTDDDAGRSLFSLSDMAPGHPAERCIKVQYTGTILPADLSIRSTSQGPLAQWLNVSIEAGAGGDFESCAGFEPDEMLYEGDLATMSAVTASEPIDMARIVAIDEEHSFRFRFELADEQQALGLESTADFLWEAVPS